MWLRMISRTGAVVELGSRETRSGSQNEGWTQRRSGNGSMESGEGVPTTLSFLFPAAASFSGPANTCAPGGGEGLLGKGASLRK